MAIQKANVRFQKLFFPCFCIHLQSKIYFFQRHILPTPFLSKNSQNEKLSGIHEGLMCDLKLKSQTTLTIYQRSQLPFEQDWKNLKTNLLLHKIPRDGMGRTMKLWVKLVFKVDSLCITFAEFCPSIKVIWLGGLNPNPIISNIFFPFYRQCFWSHFSYYFGQRMLPTSSEWRKVCKQTETYLQNKTREQSAGHRQ